MGNLNFSRFGTRGVEKMQNWDSRRDFAVIGNRVLMQRGALIFDFSLIFTKDLKVFLRICDFWRFRMFFWNFLVFFSVFAFWRDRVRKTAAVL